MTESWTKIGWEMVTPLEIQKLKFGRARADSYTDDDV